MKFKIKIFNEINIELYKTALHLAVENQNYEMVKLLLSRKNININSMCIIHSSIIIIKFIIKSFDKIQI